MKEILMLFSLGIKFVLLILNIFLFFLYGYDKFKASFKMWRVPEALLLILGAAGGGIGGFFGMFLFRHKIRKGYFYIANFIGSLIAARFL